jgi:hypothetical protein
MGGARSAYEGEERCRVCVGKPEGNRPLGKPRDIMKNIKIDIQ